MTSDAVISCSPGLSCAADTVVGLSDLVNFTATTPTRGMEPNGWTVVGLSNNCFASASEHVVDGTLLGYPAQVLFTPVAYRWDFDDGTSAESATGGATWAALELPEFSTTTTSHVFDARGTSSVVLTVQYSTQFSFGEPEWWPVEGLVSVAVPAMPVVAARESTVLVREDCRQNPRGPGC